MRARTGRYLGLAVALVLATAIPGAASHAAEAAPRGGAPADLGSMASVAQMIGAPRLWQQGGTGEGVGVALVDTGVVPVTGLQGQVVDGPDLSFESQVPALRHLDAYGHGTHLAGVIAGRDPGVASPAAAGSDEFVGVAPGARLVNVKVAAHDGGVDVSQVIAAIDWVVQHRDDRDLNIRVLNLSFGTDGVQDHLIDPLAYAVQVAWRSGIVVVVAAGNGGHGDDVLSNPALDPHVLAVGAAQPNGTLDPRDDTVAGFSSRGTPRRRPDLVAPGTSLASLRSPGSVLDGEHPSARSGERLFRGTGTSQAAAVVSGAAALLLDQRPWMTPDQVKHVLVSSARRLRGAGSVGVGMLDVARAARMPAPRGTRRLRPGSGTGSLEAARGSLHVSDGGVELSGERDVFGAPWNGSAWAAAARSGRSWDGGAWNGAPWSGDCWCGRTVNGPSWQVAEWTRGTWAGSDWPAGEWDGPVWSSRSWGSRSWGSRSWGSRSWGSRSWGSRSWGSRSWGSRSWGAAAWGAAAWGAATTGG